MQSGSMAARGHRRCDAVLEARTVPLAVDSLRKLIRDAYSSGGASAVLRGHVRLYLIDYLDRMFGETSPTSSTTGGTTSTALGAWMASLQGVRFVDYDDATEGSDKVTLAKFSALECELCDAVLNLHDLMNPDYPTATSPRPCLYSDDFKSPLLVRREILPHVAARLLDATSGYAPVDVSSLLTIDPFLYALNDYFNAVYRTPLLVPRSSGGTGPRMDASTTWPAGLKLPFRPILLMYTLHAAVSSSKRAPPRAVLHQTPLPVTAASKEAAAKLALNLNCTPHSVYTVVPKPDWFPLLYKSIGDMTKTHPYQDLLFQYMGQFVPTHEAPSHPEARLFLAGVKSYWLLMNPSTRLPWTPNQPPPPHNDLGIPLGLPQEKYRASSGVVLQAEGGDFIAGAGRLGPRGYVGYDGDAPVMTPTPMGMTTGSALSMRSDRTTGARTGRVESGPTPQRSPTLGRYEKGEFIMCTPEHLEAVNIFIMLQLCDREHAKVISGEVAPPSGGPALLQLAVDYASCAQRPPPGAAPVRLSRGMQRMLSQLLAMGSGGGAPAQNLGITAPLRSVAAARDASPIVSASTVMAAQRAIHGPAFMPAVHADVQHAMFTFFRTQLAMCPIGSNPQVFVHLMDTWCAFLTPWRARSRLRANVAATCAAQRSFDYIQAVVRAQQASSRASDGGQGAVVESVPGLESFIAASRASEAFHARLHACDDFHAHRIMEVSNKYSDWEPYVVTHYAFYVYLLRIMLRRLSTVDMSSNATVLAAVERVLDVYEPCVLRTLTAVGDAIPSVWECAHSSVAAPPSAGAAQGASLSRDAALRLQVLAHAQLLHIPANVCVCDVIFPLSAVRGHWLDLRSRLTTAQIALPPPVLPSTLTRPTHDGSTRVLMHVMDALQRLRSSAVTRILCGATSKMLASLLLRAIVYISSAILACLTRTFIADDTPASALPAVAAAAASSLDSGVDSVLGRVTQDRIQLCVDRIHSMLDIPLDTPYHFTATAQSAAAAAARKSVLHTVSGALTQAFMRTHKSSQPFLLNAAEQAAMSRGEMHARTRGTMPACMHPLHAYEVMPLLRATARASALLVAILCALPLCGPAMQSWLYAGYHRAVDEYEHLIAGIVSANTCSETQAREYLQRCGVRTPGQEEHAAEPTPGEWWLSHAPHARPLVGTATTAIQQLGRDVTFFSTHAMSGGRRCQEEEDEHDDDTAWVRLANIVMCAQALPPNPLRPLADLRIAALAAAVLVMMDWSCLAYLGAASRATLLPLMLLQALALTAVAWV